MEFKSSSARLGGGRRFFTLSAGCRVDGVVFLYHECRVGVAFTMSAGRW